MKFTRMHEKHCNKNTYFTPRNSAVLKITFSAAEVVLNPKKKVNPPPPSGYLDKTWLGGGSFFPPLCAEFVDLSPIFPRG